MSYQIKYKYTGQSNTARARTVSISAFKRSGDTSREMRQIESITYRHSHTRTNSDSISLRGRLVFADGTHLDSDVDTRSISGNVVTFTNTWSNLPSPEKLKTITAVRTVYASNGSYASDNILYWRATSDYPMLLTIEFTDIPPTNYRPKIDRFLLGRCTEQGAAFATGAEGGEYLMSTIKLSMNDRSGLTDNPEFKLYYRMDTHVKYDVTTGAVTESSGVIDLLAGNSNMITSILNANNGEGIMQDSTLTAQTFGSNRKWYFALVFRCGGEFAIATESINDAVAPIFISKDRKHVSLGGLPKQMGNPDDTVEIQKPLYLYGGIAQVGESGQSALPALGIQSGTTANQTLTSGNTKNVNITFPKPYASPPIVVAGMKAAPNSTYYLARYSVAVTNVTATGCTLRFYNYTGGDSGTGLTIAANWVAFGALAQEG